MLQIPVVDYISPSLDRVPMYGSDKVGCNPRRCVDGPVDVNDLAFTIIAAYLGISVVKTRGYGEGYG